MEGGRYEEAARILSDESLRDFRQAQQLSEELATRLAERATKRMTAGASEAGWNDVRRIERFGNKETLAGQLRDQFADRAAGRAIELLIAGQPRAAQNVVRKYQRRLADEPRLAALESLASAWDQAERQLHAGDISTSNQTIEQAQSAAAQIADLSRGDVVRQRLSEFVERFRDLCQQHREAHADLHAALSTDDWRQVLAAADRVLTVSPADRVARGAQKKAWQAVGLDTTQIYRPKRAAAPLPLRRADRNTDHPVTDPQHDTAGEPSAAERYVMWVDAVGGFLVCMDNTIVLGQPSGGHQPTIPLLADVSRRHAVVRRDAGQYVLEPLGPTKLDGNTITTPTVLGNQHDIQLGESVRLRFTRPHALSSTARLEVTSRHKIDPHVDAVLLVAESCVMGSSSHSHVACRDWASELILYRGGEGLALRSTKTLNVDGEPRETPVNLLPPTHVEGEDFALSIEPV